VDEEAQQFKDLADSRAKLLDVHNREYDALKIRNLELSEENYNLTKDRDECLEIIAQAKEIAKCLNVSCPVDSSFLGSYCDNKCSDSEWSVLVS